MRFHEIFDKMTWEESNIENDIGKVDRVLTSLRNSLSVSNNEAHKCSEYNRFWCCVAEHNLFICVFLLKRIEKIYGANDECVREGLSVINEEIKNYSTDDEYKIAWKLLSEIVLNVNLHITEYTRYLLNAEKLRNVLKHLEGVTDFDNCVAFYLYSVCRADGELRRDVFNNVMSLKWILDISLIKDKAFISNLIERNVQWNDIAALLNIAELFDTIKISAYSEKTVLQWKEFLINQVQPLSMIFYRKVLKSEGIVREEMADKLYDFALSTAGKDNSFINTYLFFAFSVSEHPEQYDTHIYRLKSLHKIILGEAADKLTTQSEMPSMEDVLSESAARGLNYLIVDKPFMALIRSNPDKVNDYIDTIGNISLYHISKSLTYRKSQTWNNNNHSSEYKAFIDNFAGTHEPDEVIKLYMNSPLKSSVDFSYVVRLLYQPKEGWCNLADILDKYVFRGKLLRVASEDKNTAYRVTLSNVFSSYRLPIHQSFVRQQFEELETILSEDGQVYFRIMSINSKGMIFAHKLSQKPQENKLKQPDNIRATVLKNIEQFTDGSIPLQGNNLPEEIRLFVIAMICDDNDKMLVNSERKNDSTIQYLPYLPVANYETSEQTLKRLLKYFIGVQGEVSFSPCGIRNICVGRQKRNVFVIYKINSSDFGEKLTSLMFKKSMCWKDIAEYREKAEDKVSRSFLAALNSSWSEDTVVL